MYKGGSKTKPDKPDKPHPFKGKPMSSTRTGTSPRTKTQSGSMSSIGKKTKPKKVYAFSGKGHTNIKKSPKRGKYRY